MLLLWLFSTFVSVALIVYFYCFVFFFKQKTAYEMRISDWSSDVCSSDLHSNGKSSADDLAGLTLHCRFPRSCRCARVLPTAAGACLRTPPRRACRTCPWAPRP